MNKSIMGFIDTYNEINIIYSKKAKYIAKNFYLYSGDELIENLTINYISSEGPITKVSVKVSNKLDLHVNYTILDDLDKCLPIQRHKFEIKMNDSVIDNKYIVTLIDMYKRKMGL